MPPTISPPFSGALDQAGLDRTFAWTDDVNAAMAQLGVSIDPALVLAIIYAESRGYPSEASDSSYGLMQVNLALWGGGYTASQLEDPMTNLSVGIPILANMVRTYGSVPAGVSAYNGGGAQTFPAGTAFCEVWTPGSAHTSVQADCDQAYVTQSDGEFGNQPYVDEVTAAYAWFAQVAAQGAPTTEAGIGGGSGAVLAVLAIVGALWAYYGKRRKRVTA